MDSPNYANSGNIVPLNFDNEPPSLPDQDSKLQDIPEQNEVSAKSNVTDNPPNQDTYVTPSIHLIRASQQNDSNKDLPIEHERSFVASRLVSGQNDSWEYSKTEAGITMADKPRNFDKKSKGPVDWPNNVGQHMINFNMEDLNRRKEPSPKKSSKSVESNKSLEEQSPKGLITEWPSMANSHWATLRKSVNPSQRPTNKSQTPVRRTVTNKTNSIPSQPGSKDDLRLQLLEKNIPPATQTPRAPTQTFEKIRSQVHPSSSQDARINETTENVGTNQTLKQQPHNEEFWGIKHSTPKVTNPSTKTVDAEHTSVFYNTQKPLLSTQE
jgi:hypothetical protein